MPSADSSPKARTGSTTLRCDCAQEGPDGRLDDVVAQRITVGLEHSGVAPPRTQPVAERSIASENPVGHFGHRLLQLIVTTDPSKKTIRKGLPYLTPRGGSLRRRSYLAQGLATLCS
jgi:hypothetical protein